MTTSEQLYSGFSSKQIQSAGPLIEYMMSSAGGRLFSQNGTDAKAEMDDHSNPADRLAMQSPNHEDFSETEKVTSMSSEQTTSSATPGNEPLSSSPQANRSGTAGPIPIAIIGMSCRFPGGADDLNSFLRVVFEGKSAWSTIPEDRFNAESFFHPVAERTTSMNVRSGHFLEGDQHTRFDGSFFNMSPNEAKATDPRARMHLEGAYEALENAGISLSDVAGTDTAVYVGAFNNDYGGIMAKDPGIVPPYKVTGLGSSLFSNRISHWLDLKGPSNTVDTACSASMSALHLACQSLRNGESRMAIASGANLVLDPDIMLSLSSFKFLSPDGKSYMFDKRANGYARGEGIATMVLKPLEDAIRDNDPVHAVIRNIRTNQDGWTPGITMPNQDAQRALIEETYKEAGLDPSQTCFFEAHGTGTQAGDRVEAEALATALRTPSRSPNNPLYVGSIKTLMGHCEGASGVAGILHATMALRHKIILPNCNFDFPSEQIKFDEWRLKVPVRASNWSSHRARQASVNSFGYGGANVHVILQESPVPDKRSAPESSTRSPVMNGVNGHDSEDMTSTLLPKVLRLSANDSEGIRRQADALSSYLANQKEQVNLDDLIYTLSHRRSLLKYQCALPATSMTQIQDGLSRLPLKPRQRSENIRVAFVFTGQGAQWARMGVELLDSHPLFRTSFERAEAHVTNLGADWSMERELRCEVKLSKINEPYISQTLCTALQLCLVDLLRACNVRPKAVVGHSSGEIAAAYAADMLSLEDAMTAAYFRGKLSSVMSSKSTSQKGGMLAVALSAEEASSQLRKSRIDNVNIACINSPQSVTLSGDVDSLKTLEVAFEKQERFHRRLKVNVAYHSAQMKSIADQYLDSLRKITVRQRNPDVRFCSSVFPRMSMETNDEYWVQNLLSPVRFSEAVDSMLSLQASQDRRIDICLELGPHSALAGPFKQICGQMAPDLVPLYQPTLMRNEDSSKAMIQAACSLLNNGVELDLKYLNFPRGYNDEKVLTDLPPYAWNHSTKHWHEGRIAHNYLHREHPSHDILGTLVDDSSDMDMRWNNYVRQSDLPWLHDHVVNGEVLLPGGAFLAGVVEAASQIAKIGDQVIKGYTLRDIVFSRAVKVPDTMEGVELSTILEPVRRSTTTTSNTWYEFRILSYGPDRQALEHCYGLVSFAYDLDFELDGERLAKECKDASMTPQFYGQFANKIGNDLGPSFRLVSRAMKRGDEIYCAVDPVDESPEWTDTLTLHAPLWDTFLQISVMGLATSETSFSGAIIPTGIGEIVISKAMFDATRAQLFAEGSTKSFGPRLIVGKATIATEGGGKMQPLVQLKNVKFLCLTSDADSQSANNEAEKLCWNEVWQEDIDEFSQDDAIAAWPIPESQPHESENTALTEKAMWYTIRAAFEELSSQEVEELPHHYRCYYGLMQKQYQAGTEGRSAFQTPDWTSRDDLHIEAVLKSASEATVQGQLNVRVGRRLVDILRGEVDPLSLMLEDDLLTRFYAESSVQDRVYLQVERYASLAAFKNPSMKILEIGGGTGSCTAWALNALGGRNGKYAQLASYDFTDISTGFFEKARERFKDWGDRITYKALNIDEELDVQGYPVGTYDMIVASNVLHATGSLDATMSRVNSLLKPGGKLVLVEATNLRLRNDGLAFALLPGWWLSTEEWRVDGPLITEDQWNLLLRRTGFTGLDLRFRDHLDEDTWTLSMMVSTKLPSRPDSERGTLILYDTDNEKAAAQCLANTLVSDTEGGIEVFHLLEADQVDNKNILVLDHAVGSLLVQMNERKLTALQHLFAGAQAVLWLTFGGESSAGVAEAGLVPGFMRTMRSESGGMSFATLSMDVKPNDISGQAQKVFKVWQKLLSKVGSDTPMRDLEFSLHDGHIRIARLMEDADSNKFLASKFASQSCEPQPLWQDDNALRLDMKHVGLLDSFQFIHDAKATADLADTEIEIETRAVGLNFHDLLVATGQLADPNGLGVECAGVVRRVGGKVQHLRLNDRVSIATTSCFATRVRGDEILAHIIPEDMSFQTAASIPSVYMTAYHSLYLAARLEKGESILIHSAAGGVGQACIQMAQLIGAKIFVTVGSTAKARFIETKFGIPPNHILNSRDLRFVPQLLRLTDNRGVDVVINSLAGEALRECWRQCIASFGRFIELGKKDAIENTKLDMAPFERSVSYIAVGLDQIYASKPEIAGRVMRNVFAMFKKDSLKSLEPITTYPISQVEQAFRYMATGTHMGKIVVSMDGNDTVKAVPRPHPEPMLRQDASYLISGGLGGIGLELARWMVHKLGARNLILLSRSGMDAADAPSLKKELEEAGANVHIGRCDVSNAGQVLNVTRECNKKFPPVRGVVQAAMVLQDAIFQNMTLSKYDAAVKPKVAGSRNLHEAFMAATSPDGQDQPLDFFVQLSSIGGILGNASQANYSAGNTFQDALAHERAASDLPALTIDVGNVMDVGWVARNKDVMSRGAMPTAKNIEVKHLQELIAYSIIAGGPGARNLPKASPQIAIGLQDFGEWDARFAHVGASMASSLVTSISDPLKQTQARSTAAQITAIKVEGSVAELEAVILQAFKVKLTRLLSLDVEEIRENDSIAAHGVDSLIAVEIRNWFRKDVGVNMAVFDILNGKVTLVAVVAKIAAELKTDGADGK